MDLDILDKEIVDLIKNDEVRVPTYPAIASQLGSLLAHDDVNIVEVARVVTGDQALAATVLACASSARFGAAARVTSLQQAIVRLGTNELFRIAWAASLGAAAVQPGPLLELKYLVWRQAVLSAFLCDRLASGRDLLSEEAFTCGLLHRFGRTIALGCLEQLLERQEFSVALPASDWMKIVGKYETELGLVMGVKWALPEVVVEVISRHRTPELAGAHRKMAELVFASDEVVELTEKEVAVSVDHLASCRQVGGRAELSTLARLIPELPAVVAALIPEGQPKLKSTIVSPEPGLQRAQIDDPKSIELIATVVMSKREIEYRVDDLDAEGLVMLGPVPLQVNSLAKLSLHIDSGELNFWGTVTRCQEISAGQFEIDARRFGGDPDLERQWSDLVSNS